MGTFHELAHAAGHSRHRKGSHRKRERRRSEGLTGSQTGGPLKLVKRARTRHDAPGEGKQEKCQGGQEHPRIIEGKKHHAAYRWGHKSGEHRPARPTPNFHTFTQFKKDLWVKEDAYENVQEQPETRRGRKEKQKLDVRI